MAKTANLNIRMEPKVKEEAENILKELGISPSIAIDIFYKQIINHKGLPFDIKLPEDHPLDISNSSKEDIINMILEGIDDKNNGRDLDLEEAFERILNRHEKIQDKAYL